MPEAVRLAVSSAADAEQARRAAGELAATLGFPPIQAAQIALAVTELATNLVRYAVGGEIALRPYRGDAGASPHRSGDRPDGPGLEIECRDGGPGIPDLALALQDGHSTGGGLGSGLPAVRRLMDEFQIESSPGGTRIVARKWPRTR
jgi:serine/threonine-protein kinase RsbT